MGVDTRRLCQFKELLQSSSIVADRLRNVGRQPAKNCLVFLTGIEEVHPSGTTVAPFYDAAPISWAGWGFSPRDVPQGVKFYCDTFRISKDDAGWLMSAEKTLSGQAKLKAYRGTYRFRLLATADTPNLSATP